MLKIDFLKVTVIKQILKIYYLETVYSTKIVLHFLSQLTLKTPL